MLEAARPLCDLCVRRGIFNSMMLSYQASDDVFDTELGIPYHCESANHERVYHAYKSPFESSPSKTTANLKIS
jgi:hypothetical protein